MNILFIPYAFAAVSLLRLAALFFGCGIGKT